jgi:hypothetical protein
MKTPRESFQLSGKAEEWKKVVESVPALQTACDYALLELQSQMPPNTTPSLPTDPYVGLDANAQMWGARRVIEILKTIAEPVTQPEPVKPRTLYHH